MTRGAGELERLGGDIKLSWQRFLDTFEPLRPELYRYCRYLTQSPWDAEDLVQDTLARAFVTLGTLFHSLPSPRAWLFQVASNLWIDRTRRDRRGRELLSAEAQESSVPPTVTDARAPREAAGTLLSQLAPQERAALVLKEVFDFSLEEIATALTTTVSAVKTALHRGRGKLSEPMSEASQAPPPQVLDAFCSAFNARDLAALTALLLSDATTEIIGVVTEYGADAPANPHTGSLTYGLKPLIRTERGGIASEYLEGYLDGLPRCEAREHRGVWLLLFWFDHVEGPAVRAVWTLSLEGERIARIRNYFFAPDVVSEICAELDVPCRTNGYRYW
jgi:RNA polymerase sigma-70 factor (ECF subfamily)